MYEKIQKLAYYKWLNAGSPEDRDQEFWFEAEGEVFLYENKDLFKELDVMNELIDEMFLSAGIFLPPPTDDFFPDSPEGPTESFRDLLPESKRKAYDARIKQYNEREDEI